MVEFGFCLNSHRWLLFMDLVGKYPKSCPHEGDCDHYDYFKLREATRYLKRKRQLLGFIDEKEESK